METVNRISIEMSEEELSQKVRAIVEMAIEFYKRKEPAEEKDEFISKKELCELIGKSEAQVWRYEQEGIFTSRKVGGRCEYERAQVERFLYLRNTCRISSTDKLKEAVRVMVQREMDLLAERMEGDVVDLASAAGVIGVETVGAIRREVFSYVKALALREAQEEFEAKKEAKRIRVRNARELERAGKVDAESESTSAFVKRSASDWMRLAGEKPPQRKLLGDLISENELTVVFSMTNIGKTALMVQVANCIASGTALEPFENECEPQRVLYFDFELNDRQFARRYIGEDGDFVFSDNFIRAQVNAAGRCEGMDYGEFLLVCIEREIVSCRATVAVVDNISFLSNELDKGRSAGNLMKRLKEIKERLGITMIVLAHTPKRDGSQPLELKDLYGSSIISILVDSCFAMGLSGKDPRARYIKQLKTRNDEFKYGGDNVCLFELSKSGNMLRFTFIGYVPEKDHLGGYGAEARQRLMERIIALAKDPTLSYRDIGAQVGISGMSVMRKIKDYYTTCGEQIPVRPQAGRKRKRTGK